jgi:PelA/Pel-15E family pectate lyase
MRTFDLSSAERVPVKVGIRASRPSCIAGIALLASALCSPWLVFAAGAQASPAPIPWSRALDQPAGWYASAEAVRIAENVLQYQHDNGGWEKNIDMARPLADSERTHVGKTDLEGGTTIDNGATWTQIRYLARVYEATRQPRFRDAMLRGVDFLLAAQYANGGWPQFYPIRRGYYEHVTFNDGAMIGAMRVLRDVAHAQAPFASVDAERRSRAAAAIARGLDVILKTQVDVDGTLTAWCAQYDHTTLRCAKARAYELPSLSGGESADVVRYLMEIEKPDPAIGRAVESAVRWFDAVKLTGIAVVVKRDTTLPRGFDRVVVADPAAPPLWARFYEIGTNKPIFVGRDGVVRSSLAEIEHERRVGYNYLGGWARELLASEYPAWRQRVGPGVPSL